MSQPLTSFTLCDQTALSIGIDHAKLGMPLPHSLDIQGSDLHRGWVKGKSWRQQALRRMAQVSPGPASFWQRQWLSLRLGAWQRDEVMDTLQITPNYLAQIGNTHCPITRRPLAPQGRHALAIVRLRTDAAWAAGHLVCIDRRARHAVAALANGTATEAPRLGLSVQAWQRLRTLHSLVTPMSHEQAAQLPMHVLPPNRLQMLNPAQAMQAFLCTQFLREGWSHRLTRIEALLPTEGARHAFQEWVMAMVPRILLNGSDGSALAQRWMVEDAWFDLRVCRRWSALALALSAEQCEELVLTAQARQLGVGQVASRPLDLATETWALPQGGRVKVLRKAA